MCICIYIYDRIKYPPALPADIRQLPSGLLPAPFPPQHGLLPARGVMLSIHVNPSGNLPATFRHPSCTLPAPQRNNENAP